MSSPEDERGAQVDRRAEARAEKRAATAERVLDGAARRRGALGPFLLMLGVGLGLLGAGLGSNLGRLRPFVLFAGGASCLCVLGILCNRVVGRRRRRDEAARLRR